MSWFCREITNFDFDIMNGGGMNIILKWRYLFVNGKSNVGVRK